MTDTEKDTLCARIDELCAENERLRQENQSVGMAAYEVGYKNGSVHYELEHCPACKNVADLQEALDENAKLRELAHLVAEYVSEDQCEGCVTKRACNAGELDMCWIRKAILEKLRELGVDG